MRDDSFEPVVDSLSSIKQADFDDLILELRNAENGGSQPGHVHEAFAEIMRLVQRALSRRFSDPHLCDDAVQSACRTFLRRLKEGEFTFDGFDDVISLIVLVAYRKGIRMMQVREQAQGSLDSVGPIDSSPAGVEKQIEEEELKNQQRIHDELIKKIDEMLHVVLANFSDEKKQWIVRCWFEKEFCGSRMTYEEIARKVGLSVRTVRRVRAEIEELWFSLVNDARAIKDR